MADVAAPLDTTPTAVASTNDATPSPSSSETSTPTPAPAGDTAAAVWKEMQTAESGGTPPDAPPDPSLAQAATQPDGAAEAPGLLPTRGPIPFDRHQAVLTRTRNEVGEKVRRETLTEFGIADTLQPKDVSTAVNLFSWLQRDPRSFVKMVQSQLGEEAASAASAPQAKPAEEPEPEPDIPLADGRHVYSAEQMRAWQQWNARKLQTQIDEKYGPLRDAHEQQTLSAARQREAQSLVSAAAKWPLFDKLRPHVKALIAAQRGPLTQTSLHDAYITAYAQHGEKMRRDEWESERSGQLTRKADASTVQPGAPRPSTPRNDADLSSRDIVRQEWRRYAG